MQLEHSFNVPIPIDEAWKTLLDIERIGPCLPGAVIESVDGDDFTGTVKVKLGPINLSYKGKASFVEKDEDARRAVIDARGRDARGNSTAAAKVTATLHSVGETTTVQVNTELEITGKPAQFGRGVMVDVGNKLLGQFADALAATIRGDDQRETPSGESAPADATANAADAADAAPEDVASGEPVAPTQLESEPEPAAVEPTSVIGREPAAPRRAAADVEPIDLVKSAGPAVAKRLAGPAAVALVVMLIAARRRQRRG